MENSMEVPQKTLNYHQIRSVAQLCPTLSDPLDCSLPGSSVHGILQARVLEWGAIAFNTQLTPYRNSLLDHKGGKT